jgi:7-cyano-7-deazaguanine synthase
LPGSRTLMDQSLIVLSGGQDSTTCLYWAIDRWGRENVQTLTFDYGQRHRVELEAARDVAEFAGVPNSVLPIDTLRVLGGNALTANEISVRPELDPHTNLPNTFVPGRNLIFLTYAAAFAYQRDIRHLVTGVAQTDYSGYPDCRDATIRSLEQTIRLGMEYEITIHTPLMHRSKAETVKMAGELGALDAMALTHTCYNGQRPPCGICPACSLRAKGFEDAGIPDPLIQRFAA